MFYRPRCAALLRYGPTTSRVYTTNTQQQNWGDSNASGDDEGKLLHEQRIKFYIALLLLLWYWIEWVCAPHGKSLRSVAYEQLKYVHVPVIPPHTIIYSYSSRKSKRERAKVKGARDTWNRCMTSQNGRAFCAKSATTTKLNKNKYPCALYAWIILLINWVRLIERYAFHQHRTLVLHSQVEWYSLVMPNLLVVWLPPKCSSNTKIRLKLLMSHQSHLNYKNMKFDWNFFAVYRHIRK